MIAGRVRENLEALEVRPTLPSEQLESRRLLQTLQPLPERLVYAGAWIEREHAYTHVSQGSIS